MLKETSIFISLILRHKPEVVGIRLDYNGWADVDALIDGVNASGKYTLDMPTLEEIVRTDSKQRYSFNADKTKIRANQGHSIEVDVELAKAQPPEILYHGTGEKFVSVIKSEGLKPKSRLYVHLSKDIDTARIVGARHGKPQIFRVLSGKMAKDGFDFFLSANGVWLTKRVPVEYLEEIDG